MDRHLHSQLCLTDSSSLACAQIWIQVFLIQTFVVPSIIMLRAHPRTQAFFDTPLSACSQLVCSAISSFDCRNNVDHGVDVDDDVDFTNEDGVIETIVFSPVQVDTINFSPRPDGGALAGVEGGSLSTASGEGWDVSEETLATVRDTQALISTTLKVSIPFKANVSANMVMCCRCT